MKPELDWKAIAYIVLERVIGEIRYGRRMDREDPDMFPKPQMEEFIQEYIRRQPDYVSKKRVLEIKHDQDLAALKEQYGVK